MTPRPIPPSFTTDYGPGHVDTRDSGVLSCDAAADLLPEAGEGPWPTVAVLHVHTVNVEPAEDGHDIGLQSVGVELTAGDLRQLIARMAAILSPPPAVEPPDFPSWDDERTEEED